MDDTRVFVAHGRNIQAKNAVRDLLFALHLNPIAWADAVKLAQRKHGGTPHIDEIVSAGMDEAKAIVIVFTGDDYARLDPEYGDERAAPQSRPNVLFEAGMAVAKYRDRTILLQIGPSREFTNISGLYRIEMDGSEDRRRELVKRLEEVGCSVNAEPEDRWKNAGNFTSAITSTHKARTHARLRRIGAVAVAILIAAIPSLFLHSMSQLKRVRVEGRVDTKNAVTVDVIGIPHLERTMQTSGPFSFTLPILPDYEYRADYIVKGRIVNTESISIPTDGTKVIHLEPFRDQTPPSEWHNASEP